MLQPKMLAIADRDQLRYTDESVEGAPPIVAIGTAIGALRGLIVDYLWLKVTIQKEKGLLYEVMADSDLITKLQPRFPEVWSFHGHNLAYNISVMTNTPEERWAWVNAGISLVRERGIRYNPNDLELCKELAFWFSHKIDGIADDAHLYYKRQFAREWQMLLGAPPYDYEERKAWIKEIADAPNTLEALYEASPETKAFVEELQSRLAPLGPRFEFATDKRFLLLYGEWAARRASPWAYGCARCWRPAAFTCAVRLHCLLKPCTFPARRHLPPRLHARCAPAAAPASSPAPKKRRSPCKSRMSNMNA
jgi:hypothetical protein